MKGCKGQKLEDGLIERFRLFEIDEMPGVGDNHPLRAGDARFDRPGVRVNVRNVPVRVDDQRRGGDLGNRR